MFSSFLKYFWLMEYKKDGAGMQRWLACRFQLSPVYQVKLRCRERTTTSCTNKLHLIYIPEEPKAYGGNSWFRFLLVDGLFELQVRFSVVSGLSARLCCLSFLLCSASCFLSSPWVSLSLYLSSCSPTPCTFCFFSSHASRIPVGELLKTCGGRWPWYLTAVILLLLHTVVMLSDKTTGEIPIIAQILFLKEKVYLRMCD